MDTPPPTNLSQLRPFLGIIHYQGQWKLFSIGPAKGEDLRISMQEGATPPTPLGGMGEHCKLPIGAWGSAPEAKAFCIEKTPKTTQISDGQEAF